MNKFNKILIFTFLILFLILVYEVYYLFSVGNNLSNPQKVNDIQPKTIIVIPTPTSTLQETSWITQKDLDAYKKLFDKKLVTSSILKTEYLGVIKKVSYTTQKGFTGKEYNEFKLTIGNNQKDAVADFIFVSLVFGKIKTVKLVNDKEVALDPKELKINDRIHIIYIINPLYDSSNKNYIEEFKLIKI